jgi:hypothetical protein
VYPDIHSPIRREFWSRPRWKFVGEKYLEGRGEIRGNRIVNHYHLRVGEKV